MQFWKDVCCSCGWGNVGVAHGTCVGGADVAVVGKLDCNAVGCFLYVVTGAVGEEEVTSGSCVYYGFVLVGYVLVGCFVCVLVFLLGFVWGAAEVVFNIIASNGLFSCC